MYPTTNLRALVLTIKLPEWQTSNSIPEFLERVRSWGYADVAARQLGHNRREVCVIAKNRLAVAASD
jgi:23S rRNA (cytidine2498-2'-O)-methyltransferase